MVQALRKSCQGPRLAVSHFRGVVEDRHLQFCGSPVWFVSDSNSQFPHSRAIPVALRVFRSSVSTEGERQTPLGGNIKLAVAATAISVLALTTQEYSVGEAIGEGAFGVVYAGKPRDLNARDLSACKSCQACANRKTGMQEILMSECISPSSGFPETSTAGGREDGGQGHGMAVQPSWCRVSQGRNPCSKLGKL